MSSGNPYKTLMVIPNDPLFRYEEKGEVKQRYFNPENYFDELHVVSLTERDDSIEVAKLMAGEAKVELHKAGRPGPFSWKRIRNNVIGLSRQIRPQIIRSYNPLFMGWLAVRAAQETGAASVVSVHDDYSIARSLKIYGPGFLFSVRGAYQLAHHALHLNRTSLGQASHVICAYRFPLRYVNQWRRENLSVIYNRVDLNRFHPLQNFNGTSNLRILNVGRQFEGKNPAPLIKALSGIENATLTLIGDGPFHERLERLSKKLGLGNRVSFKLSVPNSELPEIYRSHDVFAMAITQPGVCIPVLEAAASGLPVVINQPAWEDSPEVVGDLAEVVELDEKDYKDAFQTLALKPDYRKDRGLALRQRVLEIDGNLMERAERELYESLIQEGLRSRSKS